MTCRNIAAVLSDAFMELEALVIFDQSFILPTANLFLSILVACRDIKTRGHTNGCSVRKKELVLILVALSYFVLGFIRCSLCSK